jgi:DNA-binding NtrC family response regulator
MPMAVAAIKAGAEDFIAKPVDDHQLVAAINRGLAPHCDIRRQPDTMGDLHRQFTRLTPREAEVLDLVVQGMGGSSSLLTITAQPACRANSSPGWQASGAGSHSEEHRFYWGFS